MEISQLQQSNVKVIKQKKKLKCKCDINEQKMPSNMGRKIKFRKLHRTKYIMIHFKCMIYLSYRMITRFIKKKC